MYSQRSNSFPLVFINKLTSRCISGSVDIKCKISPLFNRLMAALQWMMGCGQCRPDTSIIRSASFFDIDIRSSLSGNFKVFDILEESKLLIGLLREVFNVNTD